MWTTEQSPARAFLAQGLMVVLICAAGRVSVVLIQHRRHLRDCCSQCKWCCFVALGKQNATKCWPNNKKPLTHAFFTVGMFFFLLLHRFKQPSYICISFVYDTFGMLHIVKIFRSSLGVESGAAAKISIQCPAALYWCELHAPLLRCSVASIS